MIIRRVSAVASTPSQPVRPIYSTTTYLGGFNDGKSFYLFPHYEEYFSALTSCLQERWQREEATQCREFLSRLKSLVFEAISNQVETWQQFEGALSQQKINHHNCKGRCIPDALDGAALQHIRSVRMIIINAGTYMKFDRLSLATYLSRLSPQVGVCLLLDNIRWIDRNCDKLSRLKIQNLKELNLNNNSIACQGMRILIENSSWAWLEVLRLVNNRIKNLGMMYLGKCKWAKLKCLILLDNMFSDEGVRDFLTRDWITMEYLDLRTKRTPQLVPFGKEKEDMWFCQLSFVSVQYLLQRKWYSLETLLLYVGNTSLAYFRAKHGQLKDFLIMELAQNI